MPLEAKPQNENDDRINKKAIRPFSGSSFFPGGVSTAAFAGQFVNNLVNSLVATEKFDAVEFGFLRRLEKAIEEGARSGVDVSELSQKFTRYSSPDFFLSFETANGGPTRYVNWSCASLHGDCPISISGAIEVK